MTCVDPGGLSVPDGVINFASVACGTTATTQFVIGNFSAGPITLASRSTLDIVTIEPPTATIAAGDNLTLDIRADATAMSLPVGMVEGAISFATDAALLTRLVQVTTAGAVIRTSAQTVDFGQTALAMPPAPRGFTIFNDGNADIDVQLVAPALPFGVVDDAPFGVVGGSSHDVDVSFTPMFTQTYSDSLGLSYAGPLCQPPPSAIALAGEVTDAPILVDYNQIDFGPTQCDGSEVTRDLTLTSNLMVPQTLTFAIDGPNAADFVPIPQQVLDGGSTLTVPVLRSALRIPETPGPRFAALEITATPSGVVKNVDLVYEVVAPYLLVAPLSLDFVVPRFSVSSMPITITNTGNAPASVTISPPVFQVSGNRIQPTPNPVFVGPGSSKQVDIEVIAGGTPIGTSDIQFRVDHPGQCAAPATVTVSLLVQ